MADYSSKTPMRNSSLVEVTGQLKRTLKRLLLPGGMGAEGERREDLHFAAVPPASVLLPRGPAPVLVALASPLDVLRV